MNIEEDVLSEVSPTSLPRRPGRPLKVTEFLPKAESPPKATAATKPVSFQRRDVLDVLNRNGKYRYYWGVYEKVRAWGGQHRSGWKILTTLNKSEEATLAEHGFQKSQFVDGCIRVNELVLMYMPMEEWHELRKYKKQLRDEQISSIRTRGRQKHSSTDYTMERGGRIVDRYKENLIEK